MRPRNVACGAVDAGDGCIAFPEGHGIKIHAVTAGEVRLAVEGVAHPLHLAAGDCVILAHGQPYRLASDLGLSPTDYRTVLADRSPGHVKTWNGGGRATIVSATFAVEERHAGMLLDILPPIAHVRDDDDDRPGLRGSLQQMMGELRDPQAGSRLIVANLASMMLAQALRSFANQTGKGQVGWLFALDDRQIGSTIGAMHDDPACRWTVQALADRAGMSRTSFAVHFRSVVGSTPMNYLAQLRMQLASDRLFNTDDAIAVVAEALGYESESAFSNAFKRHMGSSPRRYVGIGRGKLSSLNQT